MAITRSIMINKARWMACLPALPLAAVQARWMRSKVVFLPEASGPRRGVVDGGGTPLRVVFLGESTAAGAGASTQVEALAGRTAVGVAELTGHRVEWSVVGKDGATARYARRKLVPQIDPGADVMVAVLGGSDVLRMTAEGAWRREVRQLVAALSETGAKHILFSGLPPMETLPALPWPLNQVLGARGRLLDAILQDHLSSFAYTSYCDVWFPPERAMRASDGIHPSPVGYAEWGTQLSRHIARIIPQRLAQPAMELSA